jgi:hypothetical protein
VDLGGREAVILDRQTQTRVFRESGPSQQGRARECAQKRASDQFRAKHRHFVAFPAHRRHAIEREPWLKVGDIRFAYNVPAQSSGKTPVVPQDLG